MMQRGRMIPAMVEGPPPAAEAGWDFGAEGRLPHPAQTLDGLLLVQSPRGTEAFNQQTPRTVAAATLT